MFLNDEHKNNYKQCAVRWEKVRRGDSEYCAAAYIFSVPMIFEKFQIERMKSPAQWIVDWELKYNDKAANEYGADQERRDEIVINYDLTSSMINLGRYAMHLWNGYPFFHLLDCVASLDKEHEMLIGNGLAIRFNRNEANAALVG